jgi:hypothetical protein
VTYDLDTVTLHSTSETNEDVFVEVRTCRLVRVRVEWTT